MGDTQLVTQASNQFANDLYQKLAETPDNVLVCPISLHVALTLLLQGAGGTTATELATVLKLGAASNADVKEGYKAILTGIQDDVLKIANKLYPAAGYQLSPDYLSVAREYFLSDVQGLNYSNPSLAASTINDFVAEKTNNKIRDLISADTITDLTRLIIVNAVHFQATWKSTFTTAYEDYFKVTPDKRVKTKLMTQTGYFGYKEDPALDAKVLKMDYDKEGYSMVFILPNKEDGLQAMEAKLAETSLESILKDLRDTRVEVTIPKFKVEQTLKLKDILQKMGLKDVFSSKANLHGVANGDNLYVSDVIQKTFINVHENGTEAAAATGIFAVGASIDTTPIIPFRADIPFAYCLIGRGNGLLLFSGKLQTPTNI
ncbi:hypothetical protein J6590_011542 [Homalodisca vitripennis]|nr:hypothetical protein J6590_011542 [Homalodisca vitripennis]